MPLEMKPKGSALKICMVADGVADIYPRLAPTMEWDTAAGHAIVKFTGKEIVQFENKKPLLYNKQNLLNPWFVVR
jgi:3'(2'), 5'-bisphosphate nucleotidase